MGTSASSKGPGSGVSFDPPWLGDIDVPGVPAETTMEKLVMPIMVAPPRRFANARRYMGDYVRTGDGESARKALGHYSKTGMGGAVNVARRMGTSTRSAVNYFNTFRSLRDNGTFSLSKEIRSLRERGADAQKVIDAIVRHIFPSGGSIDETACRNSGASALSDFLNKHKDADVCNLSDDEIWSLTADFLGNEAFSRAMIDMGQAMETQNLSPLDIVRRNNQMRRYIQSEISAQINEMRKQAEVEIDLNRFFQTVIKNTFEVFEVDI